MDWSGFNVIKNHRVECDKCGWTRWVLVRQKNRGGSWQYRYICEGCERPAWKYVKKSAVAASGLDVDTVPIYGERNTCEVCGADGAQNHHWAPRAYFGDESEKWPQSYLCPECHVRWHKLVTPNISSGGSVV